MDNEGLRILLTVMQVHYLNLARLLAGVDIVLQLLTQEDFFSLLTVYRCQCWGWRGSLFHILMSFLRSTEKEKHTIVVD